MFSFTATTDSRQPTLHAITLRPSLFERHPARQPCRASITAATTGTAGAIVGSMICLSTDLSGTDTLRVLTARAEGSSAISATFRGADGVIPACAGSNCRASCRARLGGGYPRVRGEQRMRMVSVGPYWGSSPHALGAVLDFGEGAAVGGVIPVCAGSRHWHAAGARGPRGHPRLRGEQLTDEWGLPVEGGPSPLARGAVSMTCHFKPVAPCSEPLPEIRAYG